MAGYVYSALFFVPRQIAPFKGDSTAHYFTAYIAGIDPQDIDWGFGVGVIEELIINGGGLIVIPGLLVYGMLMGLLDRASLQVPSITVATRFAAIWLCGYNLPSIILQFGAMILTALVLHFVFVRVHSTGTVSSAQESTAQPLELSKTTT
jgi:hypothetical protein